MPSPLGHVLGGVIVGSTVLRQPGRAALAACAVAAALPDIDIVLPMAHRGPTHSVTAAVATFAVALIVVRALRVDRERIRIAAAIGLAVLSHALLDWLGEDSTAPRGLMALWPLSNAYYVSDLNLFAAVDRRYWLPGFVQRNTIAILRELLILLPVTLIARSGKVRGWFSPSLR